MKLNYTFLFFVFFIVTFGQEKITTVPLDSIPKENKVFLENNNQNLYYVTNNVFYKKGTEKTISYNTISLGNLTHVDLYNPLQIVLFYKDFNTVILVDSQLNETHKIEGNTLDEIINFDCIGLAIQNQLWFYDYLNQKIGLYNFNTNTYKYLSTPLTHKIVDYATDYNYFYWIDDENNGYRISIFGKIISLGKLPNYDSIQILSNENCIFKREEKLYFLDIKKNKQYEINISKNSFDKFYYKNGILSIFTPNKVINYKILLP